MGNLRKLLAILCTIAIMLALSPTVSVLADGPVGGFDRDDFERIADGGFGDPMNNYPWAMAYFNGDLYVGTGRNIPYMLLSAFGLTEFEHITYPEGVVGSETWAEDMLAEIWRYNDGEWEQVYQSTVEGPLPSVGYLPREWGFREMAVFEDAIYAAIGGGFFPGSLLLKSTDGTNWERVVTPIAMGTDSRAMVVHSSKLYVATGGEILSAGRAEIWATDAPSTTVDNWVKVADFSCVGPGTNVGMASLASFNGYLYAGTANIESGFQVFRSRNQSPSWSEDWEVEWEQMIYHGAGDMMNYLAGTMEVFEGQLYVGSMSLPLRVDTPIDLAYPKGFELIRIDTNDDWELVVGDYFAFMPAPADGWWDNGWKYREKLTFNNSGREQLDNFPVLVKLSDPTNIDYDETETDGADIRFVDDDNETELPYEIEEWNNGGTSWVWVNVPQIDAGSTSDFIYMYYGSCDAIDDQDPEGVWSDYAAVWHLEETGTGTRYDSTSNNNNGTTSGYEGDEATTGKIDGADDLDGTDDYINVPGADFEGLGAMTVEAWVKFDTFGAWKSCVSKWETDKTFNLAHTDGNLIRFEIGTSGGNINFNSTTIITDSNWYYTVGVYDGVDIKVYIDGAKESGSSSQSGTTNTGSQNVGIGHDIGVTTSDWMDGIVDEVRISDTARSADWIAAQYASMMDTFINYGETPVYQPRLPISGWPGGFGNFMNFYCWSLQENEGVLYLGTFDASSFLRFLPEEYFELFPELTPEQLEVIVTALEEVIDLLEDQGVDEYYIEAFERLLEAFDVDVPEDIDWEEVWQVFIDYFAGADLWKTEDGIFWWPVTLNGFGNPDNYGVRNMVAVNPLFAGMANPFNGLEIWQASPPPPYVGGVGGEVYPINKLGILAPWIGLAMLFIGSIACLTLRRRRAQS